MRKLEKIKLFSHSNALICSKKGQILLIFPVLQKLTHICYLKLSLWNVNFANFDKHEGRVEDLTKVWILRDIVDDLRIQTKEQKYFF